MTNQHERGINTILAKPLAITAGVIGLIQGLAWTVFAVLCICCYYDSILVDVTSEKLEYYQLIYKIFLSGNGLKDVILTPNEFSIFVWFYIFSSAIWACLSATIIWAMIHNQWHLAKVLFGGWSITTFLVSIIDVVLTGLIIGDYLKINNKTEVIVEISVTYGIVMTIAARGYILLIINVVFAAIMAKYTLSIILKGNDENRMPIIHGYESSGTNPPWFQNDVKDFWANPPNSETTPTAGYNNHGFERSQSFFNVPTTSNDNAYNLPPVNVYNTPISNNRQLYENLNNKPQKSNVVKPTPFSEAIANKTATIGKNRGRRSPLSNIPPPIIPPPDYTPPNSPNPLRSVLKSKSNYNEAY